MGHELKNIFKIYIIFFIPNPSEIWPFNISLQIWSNAATQWPLEQHESTR